MIDNPHRLRQERDDLAVTLVAVAAALEKYGVHFLNCAEFMRSVNHQNGHIPGPDIPVACTCGLDDALRAAAPPAGQAQPSLFDARS